MTIANRPVHATASDREIDFILYRPAERFEVLQMDVLDEPMASDHRPLVLELRVLPPGDRND